MMSTQRSPDWTTDPKRSRTVRTWHALELHETRGRMHGANYVTEINQIDS